MYRFSSQTACTITPHQEKRKHSWNDDRDSNLSIDYARMLKSNHIKSSEMSKLEQDEEEYRLCVNDPIYFDTLDMNDKRAFHLAKRNITYQRKF